MPSSSRETFSSMIQIFLPGGLSQRENSKDTERSKLFKGKFNNYRVKAVQFWILEMIKQFKEGVIHKITFLGLESDQLATVFSVTPTAAD